MQLMAGNVDEALAFGQQRLGPFKKCRASQHQQQLLHDTLALLAYEDLSTCPMSYLVSDEHRRKAARVVNAAVLFHVVNSHADSATGAFLPSAMIVAPKNLSSRMLSLQ
jgi:hypothetical protein